MSEPTRDGLLSEGFRAGFDEAALDAYGVAREHVPFEDTDEANEAREEALAMFLRQRRAQDTRPSAGEPPEFGGSSLAINHPAHCSGERKAHEVDTSESSPLGPEVAGPPSAGAGVGEAQRDPICLCGTARSAHDENGCSLFEPECEPAPAPVPCQHDELGVSDNDGFRPCLKCGVVRRWPTPPPPAIDVEQLAQELFDGLVDPKDNRSVKQTFADTIRAALRRLSPEPSK